MVARVNGASDEGGGFGVGTGDSEEVGAWKVLAICFARWSDLGINIPMMSA